MNLGKKDSWKAAAVAAVFCCVAGAGAADLGNELGQKFLPPASDMLTFTTVSQKLHEMDVEADVAWTKLADRATLVSQVRKEQGNTHQRIAAIVTLRIDDTTIAFAANNSTDFLHFCRHVHLTDSSCIIIATILISNVAQGTC